MLVEFLEFFPLQTLDKSLCSWLCLYDAIIELQPMYDKMSHDFMSGKCTCIQDVFIL